jgi:D-alanyl-D-alanine carboxypeptidase
MNTKLLSSVALALATLSAGSAFAAEPATSVTRAQVLAELAEAQRTGNIMDAQSGKMLNELHPNLYPAQAKAPGLTRAQVLAELAEAKRTGEIVDAKSGKKLNELNPNQLPGQGRYQQRDPRTGPGRTG